MTWSGNTSLIICNGSSWCMASRSILLKPYITSVNSMYVQFQQKKVSQHGNITSRRNCYCMSVLFKEVWSCHVKVCHTSPHCNAFTRKRTIRKSLWVAVQPVAKALFVYTTRQMEIAPHHSWADPCRRSKSRAFFFFCFHVFPVTFI